ncbi:MAG: isoprenylcysteine carboxylmethyltransferase family protein [Bacteroidales bacterium]|nr:isoprenylcysteine carboxylmethyltransferase family protein [Bacteroidales bacterium]
MYFRLAIWFIFIFGGIFGGIYFDNILFPGIHKNIILHIIFFIIGAILMFIVMKISKNTGRTLAKYGRKGDVDRMDTNVLVKEGIYSYMRHPMHLGLMIFPLSFAFLSGIISFIVFIAPLEIILMLIMIFMIEEPEAIRKFGDDYRNYKRKVPAFCFRFSCIKKLFKNVEKSK